MITAENARELQQISANSRKLRAAARRLTEANALIAAPDAQYIDIRLARVRLQLDRIDEMLLDEKDPQKLDRLASAQMRLSEQERQLSGRSLPPTLKPKSGKPEKNTPRVTDTPEQVPTAPELSVEQLEEQLRQRKAARDAVSVTCVKDTPTGSVPVQPDVVQTPQSTQAS